MAQNKVCLTAAPRAFFTRIVIMVREMEASAIQAL